LSRSALVALVLLMPAAARAADVDEIWSPYAAGGETVGVKLGLGFVHRATTLAVDRELLCLEHETVGGQSLCPDGSALVNVKDLEAEVVSDVLELDFRLALWRTIEARVRLPIVLFERTRVGFAPGVDETNSPTAPYNADQVFAVPGRSESRAGVADPTLGVWLDPLSTRAPGLPSLALGVELTLPLAEPRKAGTSAVGDGIFGVTLAVAGSARVYDWLEPFARFDFQLRLAASNDLYPDFGETQTVSGPAQRVGLRAGVELVPWERPVDQSAVRIEIGGVMTFVSAGKAPTVLFDAIGTSSCSSAPVDDPCTLTTTASGAAARGTTVEEEHLELGAFLGVHYDVFETLRLTLRANVGWRTPHFLTFSDIGADTDGDGLVESVNDSGRSEYDPDYVPTWDDPGGRFRANDEVVLGVDAAVTARF